MNASHLQPIDQSIVVSLLLRRLDKRIAYSRGFGPARGFSPSTGQNRMQSNKWGLPPGPAITWPQRFRSSDDSRWDFEVSVGRIKMRRL